MNSRVRQSSRAPIPPPSPDAARAAFLRSASSEDSTPTRVTPSMSFSAVTKPATASWPVAQPLISRARARRSWRASRRRRPEPPTAGFGRGRRVEAGQPDVDGQDQCEFAHHPLPVEAAVGEAGDGRDPLFAQVRNCGVGGEAVGARLSRRRLRCFELRHFALLSEIWLPVRTSSVTPARTATRAPSRI